MPNAQNAKKGKTALLFGKNEKIWLFLLKSSGHTDYENVFFVSLLIECASLAKRWNEPTFFEPEPSSSLWVPSLDEPDPVKNSP